MIPIKKAGTKATKYEESLDLVVLVEDMIFYLYEKVGQKLGIRAKKLVFLVWFN